MERENNHNSFIAVKKDYKSIDERQKWIGYIYYTGMNESLHNYSEDFVQSIWRQFGISHKFDMDHFYFCLTGLKKKIYTPIYGLDTKEYMAISMAIMRKLLSQLSQYNYAADIFVENYNDDRQIAIIYSPMREDCITPREMASHISETVQMEYDRLIFKGRNQYCNFTALSSKLSGFSSIRAGFLQANELSDFSFFRMEPIVVTLEDIEQWRKEADYHSVIAASVKLKHALAEGNEKEGDDQLKALFLSLLKDSFNLSPCMDALSHIKNMLEICFTVYEITDYFDLDMLCDIHSYNKIEECYTAFAAVVKYVCKQVNSRGSYSGIIQQAIYYMKNNYQKDISLVNISKYVGITPSYLSALFKREVGMTVSDYITLTRIERAKILLRNSTQKVYQIAEAVGFHDIKYFGRIFKKLVSLSPIEYRNRIGDDHANPHM